MGPSDRPVSVNVALMAESPPEESDEFAMRFRDLEASDVDVVRELHEDWFPIRYNQVRDALPTVPSALLTSPLLNCRRSTTARLAACGPRREARCWLAWLWPRP